MEHLLPMLLPGILPFDHPQRYQASHPAGQPRLVHHLDDAVDVLVGVRGLLGQLTARRAANDDSPALRTSYPCWTFFAARRLIARPAPWQVEPAVPALHTFRLTPAAPPP